MFFHYTPISRKYLPEPPPRRHRITTYVKIESKKPRRPAIFSDRWGSWVNRRLREAGFDEPGAQPLRIEVSFKKVGAIKYRHGDKTVDVDEVRLEVAFYDAKDKHLATVAATPEMYQQEEFKYDAEIALNMAAYGRAVSEIRRMKLPRPAELKGKS